MDTLDEGVLTELGELPCSAISDAMDKLGIEGQAIGLKPLEPGFRLVGPAFTCKYEPCGVVKGTVGDYIDDVPAGAVVVLDNAGREDCTVWGDILTAVAHRKGVAGTVINGVCRDTSLARSIGYPVFSKGHFMRTGKERVQMDAVQVPISLGEVRVNPGDILVGDGDGIVVVPQDQAAEVAAAAREIEDAENQLRAAVEGGLSLREARTKFKYHALQTKVD
ncbi:RraA family protein [Hoeflea sp.]|uniref:RraA family protein n=1 Tax=Hoeflea sp. TaxID=1940281 RepID=UPI003B019513